MSDTTSTVESTSLNPIIKKENEEDVFKEEMVEFFNIMFNTKFDVVFAQREKFREIITFLRTLGTDTKTFTNYELIDFYTNHKKYIEALDLTDKQAVAQREKIENLVTQLKLLMDDQKERGVYMVKLVEIAKKIVKNDIRIVLMRGVMFSGKTTFAELLKKVLEIIQNKQVEINEADHHMSGDYSRQKLEFAHKECQRLTEECVIKDGIAIVSNTNLQLEHLQNYYRIAQKHFKDPNKHEQKNAYWLNVAKINDYAFDRVIIIEPPTKWRYNVEECMKHKTKDIPLDTVQKYMYQLKSLPTNEKLIEDLKKKF